MRPAVLAASLLPFAASLCLAADLANSDPVYRSLRDASVTDARVVENIVLHRDNGTLTLRSGAIGFTPAVQGRDTMAIFNGEGTFTFEPAIGIERDHLRKAAGQDRVEEAFDRALLVFSDRTGEEIRGQAKSAANDARLSDLMKDLRKHLRTEGGDNLEAQLLADLYNPAQPGFFSAYLHGRKHSDLRFLMMPRGAMGISMSPEEVAVLDFSEGPRLDGFWYLSHLKSEIDQRKASSDENKRVVQAESYRVDTTIARNDRLTATATVRFQAVNAGDRVVPFGLMPRLRVSRVSSAGQDLSFIQEGAKQDGDFLVVMPQPMARGESHELTIEYSGDNVVHKAGGGNFSVGAREDWYPAVNPFHDHARYDLTFKVPKQYTLVSIGKLEREWTEQDMACTHWTSEAPVAVAGFNYGTFKKRQVADGPTGITVEGYANTDVPDYLNGADSSSAMGGMSPSRLMDQTMAEAQNALRLYSVWFGKPEFTRLAITQQPEFSFGQSWPSLVYLPMSAYLDSTQRWMLMGRIENRLSEFVDEVTPHEVSHQWWGHQVGWTTYHDQWLSEGFAFFSAGLYLLKTEKSSEKYMAYWEHARKMILEKNNFGRRPNDAGPVWMGLRLVTEKDAAAYNTVVYRKGGYVLQMLRSIMFDPKEGDKYFVEMLHDFVQQYKDQNASTEDFQRVVEKHMRQDFDATGDGKMDWFFRQWVYGTSVPRYKFDYTAAPDSQGRWLLKASLTQSEVTPDFIGLIPLYVDFDGPILRVGLIQVTGNATAADIQVRLPKKPKKASIDFYKDMLEQ